MRSHLFGPFLAVALLGAVGPACKGRTMVDDLFNFNVGSSGDSVARVAENAGATKTVAAQVNIRMASLAAVGDAVPIGGQTLYLSAFAAGANGTAIKFHAADGSVTSQLPVTLDGLLTTFAVSLAVPLDVLPGSGGYNFRFALRPSGVAHALTLGETKLDALCGGLQPDTAASTNPVELSLSATLAYNLLDTLAPGVDAQQGVDAYNQVLAALSGLQAGVEAGVDTATSHTLNDYS
ncbi:MAG: hypothetical protein EOO40_10310, partial [Deltaproteobacteria bacterium]